MERKGWTKANHAGTFYWVKKVLDDDGKYHVCMIKCKKNGGAK